MFYVGFAHKQLAFDTFSLGLNLEFSFQHSKCEQKLDELCLHSLQRMVTLYFAYNSTADVQR